MNNLPAIIGPSQQDISEMTRLREIMNGGANLPVQSEYNAQYSGGSQGTRRPLNETQYHAPPSVSFAGREDVDAMRDVLRRFKAASGEGHSLNEAVDTYSGSRNVNTREWEMASAPKQISSPTGAHEVRISLSESADGKETKNHMVVNGAGQAVVEGLSLVESAKAIMKLLNKGLGGNHTRVVELTELDEDYNRNRILAGQARARYQRSSSLNENAAAEVFKTRFETARATALATQDQIKSILESIR
jgi:hypothetical protein